MARNAEVIRQWKIVLELERSRRATINGLAKQFGVHTRTIRRDLDALQAAGFTIYDDKDDHGTYWRLMDHPFRALAEANLTLQEMCALYMSRAFVEMFAGPAFSSNLKGAFEKITKALPPKMLEFLSQLPAVLAVKPEPGRPAGPTAAQATVDTLLQMTLAHRRVRMTYHSFSSRRVKEYVVEPYRLAFGHGALYLLAFVPEYGEMRTFAVQRIKSVSPLEETFKPIAPVEEQAFGRSLGISSGKPEFVSIAFAAKVAPYISERDWHQSQKIRTREDGSIVLTIKVCHDWALQAWILSFGPFARVMRPASLAAEILTKLQTAQEQYAPRLTFEKAEQFDFTAQRVIPF